MTESLYKTIETQAEAIRIFLPEVLGIPKYISSNLKYEFFDWQKSSILFPHVHLLIKYIMI